VLAEFFDRPCGQPSSICRCDTPSREQASTWISDEVTAAVEA